MNNETIVIAALESFNMDENNYAIGYIAADYNNGNVDLEDVDQVQEYRKEYIVQESLVNGQFTQAREQCSEFGLKYEDELFKYKNPLADHSMYG